MNEKETNKLKRIDFRVNGKWLDGLLGRFTQAAIDNRRIELSIEHGIRYEDVSVHISDYDILGAK
uniref:Uncharacterized protein n=1 Tax=viral metagenome TaxID=1070528 RepID=A0A6H1ZHB9_9ZZZZ